MQSISNPSAPRVVLFVFCSFVAASSISKAWGNVPALGRGDGHAGSVSLPSGTQTVNTAAPVTSITGVTVQVGTARSASVVHNFTTNDLVMVFQTTGLSSAVSGSQTAVDLSASTVGQFEFARLASASGSTLTLTTALSKTFDTAVGRTQVIYIPEYSSLTVGASTTLTALPFDGASGGVTSVFVSGTLSLSGTVNADAAGFRGGATQPVYVDPFVGCSAFDGTYLTGNGYKGEGFVQSRYGTDGNSSLFAGYGNMTHGAGGGNCHDSGGGGGSNGTAGGNGGFTWDGDGSRDFGGRPGAVVNASLVDRLILGGGGGSGAASGDAAGPGVGGNGGGAVFVIAQSITGSGQIVSQGQTGGVGPAEGDGGGGGGAGGSVVVRTTLSANCSLVAARGGNGGVNISAYNLGPGAGGGGGRILYQNGGGTCVPPANAVSTGTAGVTSMNGSNYGATPAAPISSSTPVTQLGGPFCASSGECGGALQCNTNTNTCSASANRLRFTTPTRTVGANTCTGAANVVTIQLQDASGVAMPAGLGGESFTMGSSSSGVTWYTNSTCSTVASGGVFSVPVGQTTVNVYYRDTNTGTPSISVTGVGGISNPSNQIHTVLLSNGSGCSTAGQCVSGFCADSVCCNAACNGGPCDACSTAAGATVNGTCNFLSNATVCRTAAGGCDVAETCTGSSASCPADVLVTMGTTCRGSAGVCDVTETCNGSSASCPADTFVASGTTCRGAAGVCDVAEACTGSAASCPVDTFRPNTFGCRASAGVCDVAETCTGSSANCPADALATTSTTCRGAAGVCDVAENCTGSSVNCPADVLRPNTFTCRNSAGICDVAETCTGSSVTCPSDAYQGSQSLCRTSTGVCDVAEMCSGASTLCPADALKPPGSDCIETTFVVTPPAVTASSRATFSFSANWGPTTFQCRLDGSVFQACASPVTYNGMVVGNHLFEVRGIDGTFIDASPAQHRWLIDDSSLGAPSIQKPYAGQYVKATQIDIAGTSDIFVDSEILVDNVQVGVATSDGRGLFQYVLPGPLSDGPHDVTARSVLGTLRSGNAKTISFIVDSVIEPAVVVSPRTKSTFLDGQRIVIEGTAEPSSTVTVTTDDGKTVTTMVDGEGKFVVQLPELSSGERSVSVYVTDRAGNESTAVQLTFFVNTSQNSRNGSFGISCSSTSESLWSLLVFALALGRVARFRVFS